MRRRTDIFPGPGFKSLLSNLKICGSFIFICLMLTGCLDAHEKYVGGNVRAVNHTQGAINWMSINGYGVDGGGGSVCCVSLPLLWRPGLQVDVEWEVDPEPRAKIKRLPVGFGFDEAAWAEHAAKFRRLKKTVEVEPWLGTESCEMQVHFFVCDRVVVTTMCMVSGHPDYPYESGPRTKEPEVCPV
jgi:hypothetical protein